MQKKPVRAKRAAKKPAASKAAKPQDSTDETPVDYIHDSMRGAIDVPADAVFLVVEARLFEPRKVTAIESRVATPAKANHPVLAMKNRSLPHRDATFAEIAIDTEILTGEAMIDLDAARMIVLPCSGRRARGAEERKAHAHDGYENFLFDTHDWLHVQLGRMFGLIDEDNGGAALNSA